MRKEQFLRELGALLHDISEEERAEAMQYYEDYFADAGPEMEEQVAEELGSPEQVAGTIKAGLKESDGEFSENGWRAARDEERMDMPARRKDGNDKGPVNGNAGKPKRNFWKTAFIVLICILLLPVIAPVVGFAAVLLIAAVGCLIGLVIAAIIIAAGLLIAGVTVVIAGIIKIFMTPALGVAATGIGLLLLSIGLLAALLVGWCLFKLVPWVIRGIVKLIKLPFKQKKGGETNEEGN